MLDLYSASLSIIRQVFDLTSARSSMVRQLVLNFSSLDTIRFGRDDKTVDSLSLQRPDHGGIKTKEVSKALST